MHALALVRALSDALVGSAVRIRVSRVRGLEPAVSRVEVRSDRFRKVHTRLVQDVVVEATGTSSRGGGPLPA